MEEPRTVTRIRVTSPGRVSVELDDEPWRTVPAEAAAAAGLAPGVHLDRARARALRREIRRLESLDTALRALRPRDRSRAEIEQRLAARGATRAECCATLETLERTGLVDDERFAVSRAAALASRGAGDALVHADLEHLGVSRALIEGAIASLEPERQRADAIVRRRGAGIRTAAYLSRRGFSGDTVESVIAVSREDE
jgi:regulatory protein